MWQLKGGADGVMKGQRGCLGLISALILATAGSVRAVRVSGISHQHRLRNVRKHAAPGHRLVRFPPFLLGLMMITV